MNIFKRNSYVRIDFTDGSYYENQNITPEEWSTIANNVDNEEYLKQIYQYKNNKSTLIDRVKNSNLLIQRGMSVYFKNISEQSIPEDFVRKILDAEESKNVSEVEKYKNFWTLVSLNPDARVRNNLFWFIRKWDMQISQAGLIIAYRNVDVKHQGSLTTEEIKNILNDYYETKYIYHKEPTEEQKENYRLVIEGSNDKVTVYTDVHTHTFSIKLGEPVRIPREECDSIQEHSCSRGLHVGAKGWLKNNYYGKVGLQVLVNPANVVAVPTIDEYGKMRCCEYLPIAIIDYDKDGNVIEPSYKIENDIEYIKLLKYNGNINNEDVDNYAICDFTREQTYELILQKLLGNEEEIEEEEYDDNKEEYEYDEEYND